MPLFSIITTTYKHEKYISETIGSVLSQSFTDWELLIGDDSPDDRTWDIIQGYVKKYPKKIRAWHHAPSKGIVENINFLLLQISIDSRYIAFLEGDDIYIADCLEKKFQIFEKYPEVAIVYSDIDFINAESKVTHRSLLKSGGVQVYQDEPIPLDTYILSKYPLIVSYSSIAVGREVLNKYLPIRNLTGSKTYAVSDYDLIFQIISNFKVYGFRESLTLYRRHANNLSANYGGLFDDFILLLREYKKTQQITDATYREKIAWIHIMKSVALLASGDKSTSRKELFLSFENNGTSNVFYQLAIIVLMILPISLSKRILRKRMRRGC